MLPNQGSQFDYQELAQSLVDEIKARGQWHRAVSIDLETKIEKKTDFLTGERLLGIGMARRVGNSVETRMLRLKDESEDAEIELLYEAAHYLAPVRPLLLLGYNIAGYDYPLLSMKLKWHDDLLRSRAPVGEKPHFPREYWGLKDALTRAFVLDMMHPLRFALAEHDNTTPKYKSLSDVVMHARFSKAALMRRKQLAAGDSTENKGKVIYDMWKNRDPNFERYLEGDVHDVLLLAEELFGVVKA
ncbi:MAG: hypothetical protein NT051_03700 [Candidatus Micrarchaeota archaeon]|nr:hypothetical protein [Candidatus Micrarchaeota archaeon]